MGDDPGPPCQFPISENLFVAFPVFQEPIGDVMGSECCLFVQQCMQRAADPGFQVFRMMNGWRHAAEVAFTRYDDRGVENLGEGSDRFGR